METAEAIAAVEDLRGVKEAARMKELTRLLRYSVPYTAHLLASIVLMACVGAAQALTVLLIQPVFDRVLDPKSADTPVVLFTIPVWNHPVLLSSFVPASMHNVWSMVAFAILVVFAVKGLCDYTANYLVNYVGFSAVTDLRQDVFDKVLRQDAHFFETNSTARVMSSIMNDLEKIQVALSGILADLLRQSFTALGLLAVVLQKDWRLALVSLTLLPFVLVPTLKLGKRIRGTTRRAQDAAAELNQVLQETLSGHQVVKSFVAEEVESNRFRDRAERLRRGNLRYVRQQAIASPLIEFFGALTIVGLLWYARLQIKSGAMSTGDFVGFVMALLMLYEPVKRLTGIHNIFQQALGASQKVFEYLDRDQQIKDGAAAAGKIREVDPIRQRQFSLSWLAARIPHGRHRPGGEGGRSGRAGGLQRRGQNHAGEPGAAFYDVTAGSIKIDGRDVRELRLKSLRDQISLVAQDTFLFNDTVVGRRHIVVRQVLWAHPFQRLVLARHRNALPAAAQIQRHQQVEPFIGVRGEGERRQAGGRDIDAEFFLQFADQRHLRRLARRQFSPGEFPQPGHRLALRPAGQQHAAIDIDQCAGGDQQHRPGALLRHVRTGDAEHIVAGGLEMPHRPLGAARHRELGSLAGLAEADAAQHRGRGRIVGRHVGQDAVDAKIGEAPAHHAAGGLAGHPWPQKRRPTQ